MLDEKQPTNELFEPSVSDSTETVLPPSDSEKADNSSETTEQGGESKQEPAKEILKAKQVEAWATKVLAGKASLDDLSGDLAWLKPEVSKQLDKLSTSAPVLEKLVEKKIAEKEEANQFKSLKGELDSLGLSANQKQLIQAEFKDFLEAGLPQLKALQKAMKVAGINSESESIDLFRQAARMPKPGETQAPPKEFKQMTSTERVAEYEKMRKSK